MVRLYRPRAEILNGNMEIPGGAAGELTLQVLRIERLGIVVL